MPKKKIVMTQIRRMMNSTRTSTSVVVHTHSDSMMRVGYVVKVIDDEQEYIYGWFGNIEVAMSYAAKLNDSAIVVPLYEPTLH